jgi:hypothetical protein
MQNGTGLRISTDMLLVKVLGEYLQIDIDRHAALCGILLEDAMVCDAL